MILTFVGARNIAGGFPQLWTVFDEDGVSISDQILFGAGPDYNQIIISSDPLNPLPGGFLGGTEVPSQGAQIQFNFGFESIDFTNPDRPFVPNRGVMVFGSDSEVFFNPLDVAGRIDLSDFVQISALSFPLPPPPAPEPASIGLLGIGLASLGWPVVSASALEAQSHSYLARPQVTCATTKKTVTMQLDAIFSNDFVANPATRREPMLFFEPVWKLTSAIADLRFCRIRHWQEAANAEAALNAMADAGLKPPDIDGVATAGETPVTVAHYLGLTPKWVDGTAVGGCSFTIHVRHAAAAIASGLCKTVLITHRDSGRSGLGRTGNVVAPTSLAGQFEQPYGPMGPPTLFTFPYCAT